MSRSAATARIDRPGGWEQATLRALEWVANPALAGAAFCLLCLGVVTWLPALAATAHALHRWRSDGEQRCFAGVFDAFGGYWRILWRDGLVSTAVGVVLVVNMVFLFRQSSPIALAFFAVHLGIAAALVPYHLGLATVAARDPAQAVGVAAWRRQALVLAFGGTRGLALLAAAVAAPLLTLPIAVGPLLFGPTLPLLLALALAERTTPPNRERGGQDSRDERET
ncbi:MAG TPA: hypothetical protein VEK80_11235 [Kribbellaceae bacterium]|nr:hypothetical protein [Kribbellaceae bacterium]